MKWHIQKRLLVLVLAAGILSFLTLSGLSFYGMTIMRDEMTELGNKLGKAGANFTESLVTYQIKQALGEVAFVRANFIEQKLDVIRANIIILSRTATKITSNPENYKPVKLINPQFEPVYNLQTYMTYGPEIKRNGLTPELERELGAIGNIRILLRPIERTFMQYPSSIYIGTKHGCFICCPSFPDTPKDPKPFTESEIFDYDPRTRPWYKNAVAANKPIFFDLYSHANLGKYQRFGCSAPYYDANGEVAGVVGMDVPNIEIYKSIEDTAIGENGFSFVMNGNGEVIFSSHESTDLRSNENKYDVRTSNEKTLALAAKKMVDGKSGIMPVVVDGEEYLLAFSPMKSIGWSFATLTPRKDITAAADNAKNYFFAQVDGFISRFQIEWFFIMLVSAVLLGGLSYVFWLTSNKLSARLVKPIHELSDGVRVIASGNFDKKLDIETGDEIEHLATCFNAMTDELKTYMANLTKVTAEKQRIATELDVATDIQRGMLPEDFPVRADFELYATMKPAKEVGGDFYDFYFIDETHLAITVADVSGKGIPAALFMVISKTVLNNFMVSIHNREGLAEVVAAANDKLCANNEAMMFVTVFIGVLDLETGEFTYVNAGHNPPVVYRAEENHCDFLDVKKNFVMGPMDEIPFVEQRTTFKRGDMIFIYTDGVTEALNVAEEEYLPERLIKFMNSTNCAADLKTLLKNIRGDVAAHVGEAEQSDDITMFALRFNGSRENEA
ncbi:MAG: SpoIIE family protein phosphatase [Selenomonadaceae bacterium]|nr:SpoIIE family protein phosphatase [Selenomonadaceae bacterium]